VTDDDQTSLKFVKSLDEGVDGIVIQMVSWLIEDQNMGSFPGDHGERNSRFLSSRQEIHRSEGEVAGETERSQVASEVLHRSVFGPFFSHKFNSALLQVIGVSVMLGEDTSSQLVMENSFSIKKLKVSKECLDDSRFTSSIRTNKSDSSFLINVEVELF